MGYHYGGKIEISEMTLEQIKLFAEHKEKCKDCQDCACGSYNFVKGTYTSCDGRAKEVLMRAIELLEKSKSEEKPIAEEHSKEKTCILCQHYNEEFGYSFCYNWHNFTNQNGYCHAFSPKEISSQPVDKSP